MFSFFKHKKEKDSPAPQLIVHTEKTYEKKLPTINEERITLSVTEFLNGKYTYAQLLLENFFYVNANLQKTIAQALLQTLSSLSTKEEANVREGRIQKNKGETLKRRPPSFLFLIAS